MPVRLSVCQVSCGDDGGLEQVGQSRDRLDLLTAKMAHPDAKLVGDLLLTRLFHIARAQHLMQAPGPRLLRHFGPWLARLDGADEHLLQTLGGIAVSIQPKKRHQRTGAQRHRVVKPTQGPAHHTCELIA